MKKDMLEKIDNYLNAKTKRERTLVFFGIFLTVAFLIYSLIDERSSRLFNEILEQNQNIATQISTLQDGLKNDDILIKNQNLQALKSQLSELKNENFYLYGEIRELLKPIKRSEALNQISLFAQLHDVKIIKISNNKAVSETRLNQILNTDINLSGEFKNIINFINSLETSDSLINIDNVELIMDDDLKAGINVVVWGFEN